METTNWMSTRDERLDPDLPYVEGDHSPVVFMAPRQRFWGAQIFWHGGEYRDHNGAWWRRPADSNGHWQQMPELHLFAGVDTRLSAQQCEVLLADCFN